MLTHLDSLDRQLAALDAHLEDVAGDDRWAWQVQKLRAFRGIATLTALGLIAEIGDFARFAHPRELRRGWGSPPANTPPAISSTAGISPRAATAAPAGS